jgi:D-arginine dehydrogenase
MDNRSRYEVIIIGAGIAGASLAYFLAERGLTDVLLLERETQLAQHSTGRSAASLVEMDPDPTVLKLKTLGARFLRNPPAGFSENPVLIPSGVMVLFRGPTLQVVKSVASALERMGVRLEMLSDSAARARVPELSPGSFEGAMLLPEDGRIDVHELLSAYIRHARRRGATLKLGVEVRGISVERGRCRGVVTDEGEIRARWVVDAAGAWAGRIATLAGAMPIPLQPRRRTLVTFAAPDGVDLGGWPFVVSDADRLYFAPESGGVLLSPMDEEPLDPCDPQPDDLVIAEAFERLAALAPRLVPRSLRRKWSGLRTFAPDGVPVVGEDRQVAGFFWLAGQGGYGIETSGIIGPAAADLIVDGRTAGFDASVLSPLRFTRT